MSNYYTVTALLHAPASLFANEAKERYRCPLTISEKNIIAVMPYLTEIEGVSRENANAIVFVDSELFPFSKRIYVAETYETLFP
jgi:hypothetical protein